MINFHLNRSIKCSVGEIASTSRKYIFTLNFRYCFKLCMYIVALMSTVNFRIAAAIGRSSKILLNYLLCNDLIACRSVNIYLRLTAFHQSSNNSAKPPIHCWIKRRPKQVASLWWKQHAPCKTIIKSQRVKVNLHDVCEAWCFLSTSSCFNSPCI